MDLTTRKERSDMILEPLQVMVQLALLSQSPIGTKVSVSDNILQLHPPSWTQGAWRWWNQDGKDDLYYLFHAIRRYYKWYKSEDNRIYNHILASAVKGIEKLDIDKSLIARVMNYASVKHIISKNINDDQKILAIFSEIVQDLKNYELEKRILELESKFSQDLSEDTFNKLKELKKLQKFN